MPDNDSFPQRVWQIIAAIPFGQVTTYGDVARLAGSPRAARQVGRILKQLPEGSTLPWHRVINRNGQISLPGKDLLRQRSALKAEGVEVSRDGKINLTRYRWQWQLRWVNSALAQRCLTRYLPVRQYRDRRRVSPAGCGIWRNYRGVWCLNGRRRRWL